MAFDLANDDTSTDELIAAALREMDAEDVPQQGALTVLHFRGNREVFEAAAALTRSENPAERALGADILGQLGVPERTYPEESLELLLDLLGRESAARVLYSIGVALGHLHDARAIEPLARLKEHPDPQVRFGVVVGMLAHEDDLAVATLIECSGDEDDLVRDWATFGLGVQIERDTPAIRAALLARVADRDEATRLEALSGLARRRDRRILDRLVATLADDTIPWEADELCPALLAWQHEYGGDPALLAAAVENCHKALGDDA